MCIFVFRERLQFNYFLQYISKVNKKVDDSERIIHFFI